jgi:small GTP-binding protein
MKDEEDIPSCKITLIGDSGVGKSSIIGRFITGFFNEEISSTLGLNYSQKYYEKNGKKISLNLWDTAGQEKFRSLGKNFYKDSFIIIIVYDICNKASFQSIKEVWYPDIQRFGEKVNIIALVGNKKDKYEDEEVPEEEAKLYAQEIDANFFLVSANSGDGIERMFQTLADNFFDIEFIKKIDEARESRIDSIVLSRNGSRVDKSKTKCC